jgi:hypothetical protein
MNRKKRRPAGGSAARSAHDTKQRESFQALVAAYRHIAGEHAERQKQITDVDELRDAEINTYKELMRVAFLSNPAATEDDFERLWPRLREDALCSYANVAHARALQAVTEALDRELRQQPER